MSDFLSGYVVGRAVLNRRFMSGLGLCLLVALALVFLAKIFHAVATITATDDRPPSAQFRNPAIATHEVLEALGSFGDCELSLPVAIPPPAEGRPVFDAMQFQRQAVMSGKIVRQYDTDADKFRRVEVRIDHSADDVTVAGAIHAAFTRTEAMTIEVEHGRQVYHKVQGWKCEKAEFRSDPARDR